MGRKVAVPLHVFLSIGAGFLFFYFVLPRWPELVGDTSHSLGTALRIVTGVLIGLTALPVVFTLLRTRKPELGVPQLALTIRIWSIVAHVLAGVLIVGTAISEIWLNLDTAGRWLFAVYGAAAAIAVLAMFAFYLSFVAELPPPPPKPIKPKEPKKRRVRGKKRKDAAADEVEDETEAEAETEAEDAEEEAEDKAEAAAEVEVAEESTEEAAAAEEAPEEPGPESATEEAAAPEIKETPETKESPETKAAPEPRPALRNRRPTGKTSHRRRRTRGGVAVEE